MIYLKGAVQLRDIVNIYSIKILMFAIIYGIVKSCVTAPLFKLVNNIILKYDIRIL